MNSTDQESIESLLKQMSLRAPSQQLDEAVAALAGRTRNVIPAGPAGRVGRRFGWTQLISTALVASLGGLLLGQAISLNSVTGSAVEGVAGLVPQPPSAKMTPVNFNVSAFELLHGHSTDQSYANCGVCHVNENEEAFEGWYYGDETFSRSTGPARSVSA